MNIILSLIIILQFQIVISEVCQQEGSLRVTRVERGINEPVPQGELARGDYYQVCVQYNNTLQWGYVCSGNNDNENSNISRIVCRQRDLPNSVNIGMATNLIERPDIKLANIACNTYNETRLIDCNHTITIGACSYRYSIGCFFCSDDNNSSNQCALPGTCNGTCMCNNTCLNGGYCDLGQCVCSSGFRGPACQECDLCKNNGTCIGNTTIPCQCTHPYYGVNCEYKDCVPQCPQNKTCSLSGTCEIDYQINNTTTCVPECLENQTCLANRTCKNNELLTNTTTICHPSGICNNQETSTNTTSITPITPDFTILLLKIGGGVAACLLINISVLIIVICICTVYYVTRKSNKKKILVAKLDKVSYDMKYENNKNKKDWKVKSENLVDNGLYIRESEVLRSERNIRHREDARMSRSSRSSEGNSLVGMKSPVKYEVFDIKTHNNSNNNNNNNNNNNIKTTNFTNSTPNISPSKNNKNKHIYEEPISIVGKRSKYRSNSTNMMEKDSYINMFDGELVDNTIYEAYDTINSKTVCEFANSTIVLSHEERNSIKLDDDSDSIYQSRNKMLYTTISDAKFFADNPIYWEPPKNLPNIFDRMSTSLFREIQASSLTMTDTLGEGEFGKVSKGAWQTKFANLPVAIKTLKETSTEQQIIEFMREAAIIGQFHHPNVLKLIGIVSMSNPFMIVTELMKIGMLEYLNEIKSSNFKKKKCAEILLSFSKQIASGMAHLTKKKFVHRDLAARNVLIAKDLSCRIADFGLSRMVDSDYDYYTSSGGQVPLRWTAPESIAFKKYSEKSDVWSYGMTLYEIWSVGSQPWGAMSNEQVINALVHKIPHLLPKGAPIQICNVIKLSLDYNPDIRPHFRDIISLIPHPMSL